METYTISALKQMTEDELQAALDSAVAIDFEDAYGVDELEFVLDNYDSKTVHIRYKNKNNDILTISDWNTRQITTFAFGSADAKESYTVVTRTAGNGTSSYINLVNQANAVVYADYLTYSGEEAQIVSASNLVKNKITTDAGADKITLSNGTDNQVATGTGADTITLVNSTQNTVAAGDGEDSVLVVGGSQNSVKGQGGNDVVTGISGSANTLQGGGAADVVRTFNTKSNVMAGGAGNDILTSYGGNDNVLAGGAGNDTYKVMTALKDDMVIVIDQTSAASDDQDRLILAKVSKNAVDYNVVGNDLQITNKTVASENATPGMIIIQGWVHNPLTKIIFKDSVVNAESIKATASLKNNEITYVGEDNIQVLTGEAMYKNATTSYYLKDVTTGVTGGLQLGSVYGANAGSEVGGDVSGNAVYLTNVVAQKVRGGYTTVGEAADNHIVLTNSYVQAGVYDNTVVSSVVAGQTDNGSASGNSVTLSGGEVNSVAVTRATTGATNNHVYIRDGVVVEDYVQVGRSTGGVITGNTAEMSGGNVRCLQVARGKAVDDGVDTSASKNVLTMTSGYVGTALGADMEFGQAINNTVEISGANASVGTAMGARVRNGAGVASGNTVTLKEGAVANDVYGGYTYTGTAGGANTAATESTKAVINGNTVNILSGAQVTKEVLGGYGRNGNAEGNIVNVQGKDTYVAKIYGGCAEENNIAKDNTVNINAAQAGTVYGGTNKGNGAATGNIVNVENGAQVTEVYGGYSKSAGNVTGNTVNISDSTVENVHGGLAMSNIATDNTVNISGASKVTNVYGADGRDYINIGGTSEVTNIYGNGGDDEITISGGTIGLVSGGTGSDTYNIAWKSNLAQPGTLTIDNTDYAFGDVDTFIISNMNKTEFTKVFDSSTNTLTLTDGAHGVISIKLTSGLASSANFSGITFKDGFLAASDFVTETLARGAVLNVTTGTLTLDSQYDQYDVNFSDSRIINIDATNGSWVQTIYGNAKDNTIYGSASSSFDTYIYAGNGNDVIYSNVHKNHTTYMYGQKGNDTYNINTQLGQGISLIVNQTDAGNTDSDTLVLSQVNQANVKYEYFSTYTDSLGKSYANVLHIQDSSIGNSGDIYVYGWNDKLSKIQFADGEASYDDVVRQLNLQEATIKTFMQTLDNTQKSGFAAVDEAVATCSNGKYASLSALVASFKADCTAKSGSTVAEQKQFLYDYCGIDLNNEDTGAISGYDAGGSAVKTAASVVEEPSNITVADFTYDHTKYDTITAKDYTAVISGSGTAADSTCYKTVVDGITLYWNESNWSSLGTSTTVLQQIMSGIITTWMDSALDLIADSYNMTLDEVGSILNKLSDGTYGLQICFENNSSSSNVAYLQSFEQSTYGVVEGVNKLISKTVDEVLVINTAYYQNAITDVNGNSSRDQIYLDRLIAHELVHGVMAADVNDFSSLPIFIKEGLAELVHGADDSRYSELLTLANTETITNLDTVFNTSNANVMVDGTYGAGYALLRYLAKQVGDEYIGNTLQPTAYSNNIVKVNSQTENTDIYAVNVATGTCENNAIRVFGGEVQNVIDVNITETGTAKNNAVNVYAGTVAGNVYAAKIAAGEATGNTVNIGTEKDKFKSSLKDIYGAYANTGTVTDNSIQAYGYGTSTCLDNVYGGISVSGDVNGNIVNLYDVEVNESTYGGYSTDGDVSNNKIIAEGSYFKLTSEGSAASSPVYSSSMFLHTTYGGYSEDGNVSGNEVSLTNTCVDADLYGAKTVNGNAIGNKVTINNSQTQHFYGAYVCGTEDQKGLAQDNVVSISGEGYSYATYGIHVEYGDAVNNTMSVDSDNYSFNSFYGVQVYYGNVTGNTLNVRNATSDGINGVIIGDYTTNIYGSGTVSNNMVIVDNCEIASNGGIRGVTSNSSDCSASYNSLTVKNTKMTGSIEGVAINGVTDHTTVVVENSSSAQIVGGSSDSRSTYNTVTLKNVTVDGVDSAGNNWSNVYGGIGGRSCSNYNEVLIEGSTLGKDVYGGYSAGTESKNNSVNISSSSAQGDIYGGHGYAYANDNSVTIYSSTISGNVYGGYSESVESNGNSVTISGTTQIGKSVYGGFSATVSNNTVIVQDNAVVAGSVYGGYAAYYPGVSNNNIITIKESASVQGAVEGGNGTDTIIVGSSNATTVNANDGADLLYSLSKGNILSGGAGLDTYVVDWTSANGVTITDTKESANILQIVDGSGVSVSKSADGTSLLLTDATQTLTISAADSISAIEFLGESSKKTYNMESALASIGTAALSFDTGLSGYATLSAMTDEDKNHLSVVSSNKA